MSSSMRQYASNLHPDYLEKLQDLRKEYTPVLAGRKSRNAPKEAQAFLARRKEMQKATFKPRPVAARSPVKQVTIDLSKELERRDPSPEPADEVMLKPARVRIPKVNHQPDSEPTPALIPVSQPPIAPPLLFPPVLSPISKPIAPLPSLKPPTEIPISKPASETSLSTPVVSMLRKPAPVLQIETHNLMIAPKPTPPAGFFIPVPEIDPTALLFPSSLYRPPPMAMDQFRVFVGGNSTNVTPEKQSKRKGEVTETVSFDEFMNQVVVTPRIGGMVGKTPEFKAEESVTPVKSQASTTPSKTTSLLHFKEAAYEKERKRQTRLKAAIKLQSLVRMFLSRRRLLRLRTERRQLLATQAIQATAMEVKRRWAVRTISNAILAYAQYRRDEKSQLVVLFRNHCAVLIQKHWRGYVCRRAYLSWRRRITRRRQAFQAAIAGWRLRKAIHLKAVQDIIKQIRELAEMVNGTSERHFSPAEDLIESAKRNLPTLKGKLVILIEKMQENATWVKYKSRNNSVPQTPKTIEIRSQAISTYDHAPVPDPPSSRRSYEDRPIRPLKCDYVTVAEQGEEVRSESPRPKMKFSNFLRKSNKVGVIKQAMSESDHEEEKPIETLPVPASLDPQYDDPPSYSDVKSIKPFLKRKSQTIKPKKLKWKVTRKIDCWIDRSQPQTEEPAFKPKPDKSTEFVMAEESFQETPVKEVQSAQSRTMTVDDLEVVFEKLLGRHTDAHAYFKRPQRRDKSTFIPQFQQFSYFITHFTEDIFRDTFLALEKHYKLLCRDDWYDS